MDVGDPTNEKVNVGDVLFFCSSGDYDGAPLAGLLKGARWGSLVAERCAPGEIRRGHGLSVIRNELCVDTGRCAEVDHLSHREQR